MEYVPNFKNEKQTKNKLKIITCSVCVILFCSFYGVYTSGVNKRRDASSGSDLRMFNGIAMSSNI
jgi:hypothetical protein